MVILKTTMFVIGLLGLSSASVSETVVPGMSQCTTYLNMIAKQSAQTHEWVSATELTTRREGSLGYTAVTFRECIDVIE